MQSSAGLLLALCLSFCLIVNARPIVGDDVFLQNRKDAITLNAKFKTLSSLSPCRTDEIACVNDNLAQCVEGRFVPVPCNAGLVCRASPSMDSPGTTIGCMVEYENKIRILTTRAVDPNDPSQSSLTLDPQVISLGFQNDGQSNITDPGQSASQTSSNNWVNFCKTVTMPLTNGLQIHSGSCNNAPLGVMPSTNNTPSSKFVYPQNFAILPQYQNFTVQLMVNHLDAGKFTNPDSTYMAAPQTLNANGDVLGHSHIAIEQLTGFNQTTPTDPNKYAYFKTMNAPGVDGILTAAVDTGLAPGYYRLAAINTAMNHQPIAVSISRRGTIGDMVYFSVV